jgi:peptidoglycan/xylan/chitin deacetylase (PgdA/CDA1 family)
MVSPASSERIASGVGLLKRGGQGVGDDRRGWRVVGITQKLGTGLAAPDAHMPHLPLQATIIVVVVERLKRVLRMPLARLLDVRSRLSWRRLGLAVYYHRLGDEQGDLHATLGPPLPKSTFEDQLRYLAARYRLVTASELMSAVRLRRRGERLPVAITFDDDSPSHVEHALPLLARHGVRATFFLSGASLDGPFRFWWERLQAAWDRGLVDGALVDEWMGPHSGPGRPSSATIHEAAARIQALPRRERDAVAQRLLEVLGPDPAEAAMPTGHVQALAEAGHEIGFHTLRHDPMTGLDRASLARAVRDGREILEKLAGRELTSIAYPHGGADRRVADAAREAGFSFGFVADGGAVAPSEDPLLLPRRGPALGSLGHFALDVARALATKPTLGHATEQRRLQPRRPRALASGSK